jgi:heme/copper-type cytochrome/quinol oxidase subunit 2
MKVTGNDTTTTSKGVNITQYPLYIIVIVGVVFLIVVAVVVTIFMMRRRRQNKKKSIDNPKMISMESLSPLLDNNDEKNI